MLRLNLSTRPFYNERGFHVVLGIVAIALAAVTAFNAWQLVSLSSQQTGLAATAGVAEGRAGELRQQAQQVRSTVQQDDLEQVLAAAREANVLIDRRMFSWTELLNQIETTLPPDVMLQSVRPVFNEGEITVQMGVIGRRVDDIEAFVERLEKTGAFRGLLLRDEQLLDTGTFRASIESRYVAASSRVAADTTPAAAKGQVPR